MTAKHRNLTILICLLIPFFLLLSFMMPVNALVGSYEQRTNPSNPLMMNVDLLYQPASGSIVVNNVETMYHQVFLIANSYYALLIAGGPAVSDDFEMDFYYSGDSGVDDFWEPFWATTTNNFLLFIKPTLTGYYNLTITGGTNGLYSSVGFDGIGFLTIPHKGLNELFSRDDWDFGIFSGITMGYVYFASGGNYIVATEESGQMHYYPYASVYRMPIDPSDQFIILSENTNHDLNPEVDASNGFIEGYHILFSLDGDEFGLMAYTSLVPSIPGYSLILIGLILIIKIPFFIRKFKK